MKSIIHKKEEGTCYLCQLLYQDYSRKTVQEHHVIYGRGNRKLSEKYGLKVYLCYEHHEGSKDGVHFNREYADLLKQIAQKAFNRTYPELDFVKIFRKNNLIEESDVAAVVPETGFREVSAGELESMEI